MIKSYLAKYLIPYILLLLCFTCFGTFAAEQELTALIGVTSRSLPDNKAQILLEFSAPVAAPTGFAMNNPNKMIFDFMNVQNNLTRQLSSQKINLGVIVGINIVQSGDKTRMILDVNTLVPYIIDTDRNSIIITIDNAHAPVSTIAGENNYTIAALDFRRGEQGEGRLVIDFTLDTVPIDFSEVNEEMRIQFRGATIPEKLMRRFDVSDFGTNIQKINIEQDNDDVIIHVIANGEYEKFAYQIDKQYILEVRPVTAGTLAQITAQKFKFTGDRISLNFQDIPIRGVLQLIADFTNLNIIVSDSVQGNITLRLDNIPWDEALAYILQSKGLAKRNSGTIMMIGPSDEVNSREQLDLQAQQQAQALAPLQSEYMQINYAKAADIATAIKDQTNNLLSPRGVVSVDTRTNTLLVKDIAENLINVRQMIERLDIPVRQVMIEAQLVETDDNIVDAFGLQMTSALTAQLGKYIMGAGPNLTLSRQFANSPLSKTTSSTNLNFDFTDSNAKGFLGLSLGKLPGGTLVDVELQALESEAITKTVARPKLVTQDGQKASIETGVEIPYTTTAQQGSTPTTTFKKAVLKLEVTPQITPNNKVAINLTVNNDSPTTGPNYNGQVGINTTTMTTNILVDDGETVVLGGIFKYTLDDSVQEIPILSKIPILGGLFRAVDKSTQRSEILIFLTPHILHNVVS